MICISALLRSLSLQSHTINSKASSLFFIKSSGIKEVKDCIFTRKLSKGTYHIDTKTFNTDKFTIFNKRGFISI